MEHTLDKYCRKKQKQKKMKRNGLAFKDNMRNVHFGIEQLLGRKDKIVKVIPSLGIPI